MREKGGRGGAGCSHSVLGSVHVVVTRASVCPPSQGAGAAPRRRMSCSPAGRDGIAERQGDGGKPEDERAHWPHSTRAERQVVRARPPWQRTVNFRAVLKKTKQINLNKPNTRAALHPDMIGTVEGVPPGAGCRMTEPWSVVTADPSPPALSTNTALSSSTVPP